MNLRVIFRTSLYKFRISLVGKGPMVGSLAKESIDLFKNYRLLLFFIIDFIWQKLINYKGDYKTNNNVRILSALIQKIL